MFIPSAATDRNFYLRVSEPFGADVIQVIARTG